MSNPEKEKTDIEEEEENNENSDGSDYVWSDLEEGEILREIVLALPAMSVTERANVEEQTTREQAVVAAKLVISAAEEAVVRDQTERVNVEEQATREQAVVAAKLVISAAEEAVVKENKLDQTVTGEASKKKKVGRPRKVKLDVVVGEGGVSGSVEGGESAKKPRRKSSSQLTHPPQGTPTCNICARKFGSWKAVFGHLRAHKNRGYQGFLPPPTFNAAEEELRRLIADSSSGGGGFGYGTGGLEVDLNDDPMENVEEEAGTSGSTPKFDLNRSPPQDEEEEKEEDNAK